MAADAVRLLLPRLPLMLKTTFSHYLSLNPESSKWDLKSALVVNVLRSIMSGSRSTITKQQEFGLKEPTIKKDELIIKDTFAVPSDDDVREALWDAIEGLGQNDELFQEAKRAGKELYERPDLRDVTGEWIGYRNPAYAHTLPVEASPATTFAHLTSTTTSPLTILYFHGGAYILMDPFTHRAPCAKFGRLTGGRCFSVRYRLAPQHPFPAALLDAIVAYLSLLYPAEGALHEPVEAKNIVYAGDSAGGGLSCALLLFLLWLKRERGGRMMWNGREVEVPIPGGVATIAAWVDITRALPSIHRNAHYDYLPAPSFGSADSDEANASVSPAATTVSSSVLDTSAAAGSTALSPKNPGLPPPCPAWPHPPRRADLYSPNALLTHPLVSPLAATPQMWGGRPPMYFCLGEEMLADEVCVTARRCAAAASDSPVRLEQFEAQPHCFAMFFDSPVSRRCFDGWARFMRAIVDPKEEKEVPSGGTWISAPRLEEMDVEVAELCADLSDEEVQRRMRKEADSRIRVWQGYQTEEK